MPHATRVFLLWLLTGLFLLRVFGQVMVGIYQPASLPAWGEWYSGLMPYPWLFLSQLFLLMFMAVINTDQARMQGRFYVTSMTVKRWLLIFSGLYAGSMILRYGVRMTTMPDQRWFGGTIPIWFHFVLAAWVGLLALPSKKRI